MRNLFRFLSRNYFLLLFVLLETISFVLIFRFNSYQGARFLNSANALTGSIYERYNAMRDYFYLQKINAQLAAENSRLKNRLQFFTERSAQPGGIAMLQADSTSSGFVQANTAEPGAPATENDTARFRFIPAKVVNMSVNRQANYVTLNKGRRDGIAPDMGITGPDGIVGIVTRVSLRYAIGAIVLNKSWSVSAKFKKNNYFGSLTWDGADYRHARLNEIPFHVEVAVGDTIVTSGHSDVFPEGILIGQVENCEVGSGDNFYEIRVRLSTNFRTLSYVEIVKDYDREEIMELTKNTSQ